MKSTQKWLSARELLTETFDALKSKLNGKEVGLPLEAMAEIARDSNWHWTRVGYTVYRSAVLLKAGSKEWAVAFGTVRRRSYDAKSYNCDIVAVPFSNDGKSDKRVAEEVHDALEGNNFFFHSLVYAMADGHLVVNENGRFGQKVIKLLNPRFLGFVMQDLEIDPRFFTTGPRSAIKSAVTYRKEFVNPLSEALKSALAQ
ncbi:MAG: hypothetical protein V1656_00220 [Candidatus Jorgensenbacteria bacterium]